MNESPFLTVTDLSKELRMHEMTVYKLLKTKKIPGFKVGSHWRVSREMLDEILEKGQNGLK